MKILWNKNPLATQIELNEIEKVELWYMIKIEELKESIYTAHFYLTLANYKDEAQAIKSLNINQFENNDEILDKYVNEYFEYYFTELKSIHMGDCTCIPCSCSKCCVENYLEIDTIKGLGKHEAVRIQAFFNKNPEASAQDCLSHLEKNISTPRDFSESLLNYEEESRQKHFARWRQEDKNAYIWMKNYVSDHGADL